MNLKYLIFAAMFAIATGLAITLVANAEPPSVRAKAGAYVEDTAHSAPESMADQ